jgi:uncharacterized membrane protein
MVLAPVRARRRGKGRSEVPPSQTYYDVLEVPANAPSTRIKESYHVLASVWHPDRFPRGSKQYQLATRKLREINAAYEVLKDVQRRVQYDRRLIQARRVGGVYWALRAQGHYGAPTSFPSVPAMLTYSLSSVTGLAFLLLPSYRHDRLIRFHAWQAILLGLAAYLGILLGPSFGLHRAIYWVLWMTGFTLYTVFLMKHAYYNEYCFIPLLGEFAARRARVERGRAGNVTAEESR